MRRKKDNTEKHEVKKARETCQNETPTADDAVEQGKKTETANEAEAPPTGEAEESAALAERLEKTERELAESQERYLRLVAEYDNFRKRSQREKEQRYNDALFDVSAKWLPVLDNLERAASAVGQVEHAEVKRVAEGLALVEEQAQAVLRELGVEEIEAEGASFNPDLHEAVMHIEDEQFGEAEIVEVFQKGYKRGERILRYSVVKVAN